MGPGLRRDDENTKLAGTLELMRILQAEQLRLFVVGE
jgi:hypothetical protein